MTACAFPYSAGPRGFVVAMLVLTFAPLAGTAASGQEPDENPVAALVNDQEIRVQRVERELRTAIKDLDVAPEAMQRLRRETLEKLIDRQLVLAYLEQHQLAASAADVDLAWKRLESEVQGRGRTMDDYSHQLGMTPVELRESMRWSLSWKNLLDRFLTDANVEKYFERHRRDFDGTQLHVAHLLLKVARPEDTTAALAKAKQIRAQIMAGELKFADAARQHSEAPTAEQGGDIGWISRHQPMPESFNRAAFATKVGDVSEPVSTAFGVHLIACLDERTGQLTWQKSRGELEKAMAAYLFTWTADQQRASAKIERTGALPGKTDP